MYVYMYVCIYVCSSMYVYMYVCMYVCMYQYVCMYVCIYVCMYVCIQTRYSLHVVVLWSNMLGAFHWRKNPLSWSGPGLPPQSFGEWAQTGKAK